ncbi:peptidylprolyl isomerase, partial [Pseudoalteromonas sp. S407]
MMITLATGIVYLEVNPELAPAHVERLRSLASQGFYRGLSMYRFVEGFVAQGGAGDKDTDVPTLKNEFVSHSETTRPLDIVINEDD